MAGTLGAATDSLVSAGVQANARVTLEGARDTIYQASDELGRADFGSISPGAWTIVVRRADLAEHDVFEAERTALTLVAGERRDVELRIVPQRRGVIFIGGESELKAKPRPPG